MRRHARRTAAKAVPVATALATLALLAGCAAAPAPRNALPPELADEATVAGIPTPRFWADAPPEGFQSWLRLPDDELRARYGGIMGRPHAYLLISGGGGDGAFGAGLLAGWSAAGDRPEFQIVTGISTGGLIAPFAFLGPAYDARLREIYTSYSTREIARRRGILEAMTGDAAFDTTPLRRLLERYIGDAEVAAIAAEARKGRSLLIGTTNIDSARGVIWDVTRIAASGRPEAKKLIHDVMLASASIPGAFPPVRIRASVGGVEYDEMHVDGGVTSQLFLGPEGLDWRRVAERLEVQGAPQIYVIRNSRLVERFEPVEQRLGPIVTRTIASLIRTQGIGDLARIYIAAENGGLGFNLARVPADFAQEPAELFDPVYMRALYEKGESMARRGYPWVRGQAD